jgi:hypothetical protein
MDPGLRSPLIEMFLRGDVAADVRLLAAQGVMAPRAQEQLALLVLLSDDPDPEIARTASATIAAIPVEALSCFLARTDVPAEIRQFFAARGIEPAATATTEVTEPLLDAGAAAPAADVADNKADPKLMSALPVVERMKLAMKGSREQRAQLIRDPNRMVSTAVLSSPKLTDSEIESFTKMGNVSEDVLRIIGMNRGWQKNYSVILGLVRNPKTPPGISMQLLHRLTEKDVKMLAVDRNVPESLRLVARKLMVKALR